MRKKRSLPIWIGLFEAQAILLGLQEVDTPRPLTHDLISSILQKLDTKLDKVVITNIIDNTFYALLYLKMNEQEVTVDSRPSDGIALALKTGAPIFISEEVMSSTTVAMGILTIKKLRTSANF